MLSRARETMPEEDIAYMEEDLKRAHIAAKWRVMNSSLYHIKTTNTLLATKSGNEFPWINRIAEHTNDNFALIAWSVDDIKGDKLREL